MKHTQTLQKMELEMKHTLSLFLFLTVWITFHLLLISKWHVNMIFSPLHSLSFFSRQKIEESAFFCFLFLTQTSSL